MDILYSFTVFVKQQQKNESLLAAKHYAKNFGFMTISTKSVPVLKELRKILS